MYVMVQCLRLWECIHVCNGSMSTAVEGIHVCNGSMSTAVECIHVCNGSMSTAVEGIHVCNGFNTQGCGAKLIVADLNGDSFPEVACHTTQKFTVTIRNDEGE